MRAWSSRDRRKRAEERMRQMARDALSEIMGSARSGPRQPASGEHCDGAASAD